MAIKGKGRTRGRRVIAAPPRPQLVVRKPPIFKRRWVQVTAAAVLLLGIGAIVFATLHGRSVRAREDRETNEVARFRTLVLAQLPQDRQPVPPDLLVLFPNLGQDLSSLTSGDLKPADAAKKADAVSKDASAGADGLQTLQVNQIIGSEFADARTQMQDAQFLMVQSLRIWENVGALMKSASAATGDQQKTLVAQIQDLQSQAGALFDRGYAKVVRLAKSLGINTTIPFQPSPPPVPPAVPTSPPASPTPSASASS